MLFRPLLPSNVHIAEMEPARADPSLLVESERAAIARAVDKRRREYAAGRLLAHDLLRRAGADIDMLLNDKDRVPCWPQGVHGCISHCISLCAVAVVSGEGASGIGIDVENAQPMREDLHPMVLRDVERARVAALPADLAPIGCTIAFSIKEAVYKAIYPHRRVFLDFHQVELDFEGEDRFVADVLVPEATLPGLLRIRGRFRVADGHIASAVILPTPAARTAAHDALRAPSHAGIGSLSPSVTH